MNFKKSLKSKEGQAIAEYVMVFTVITAAIIAIALFASFNPDNLGLKSTFNRAIDNAITNLNR